MNLLKAVGTVSSFTFLSRITGLIRETLIASVFGAGAMTDAFFVAFRIPNLLRRIFAEGAFTQAFVPTLARSREGGNVEQTRSLINATASGLMWALLLISLLGVIAAPLLVFLIGGGLPNDAEQAAVVMTRWMFPYILLISLVALAAGILNTWGRFAIPAFTPVLLNLSMIGAAILLKDQFDPPILALAAGVMIGGVAQLCLQLPALTRLGLLPTFDWRPWRPFTDPQVRGIIVLIAPVLLSVSVAQISLIINTRLATGVGPGAVSWITFADRLMEFPIALIGVALGVVLTPSLSAAHKRNDQEEYSALLDWGLRICVILSIPAMVGLGLFSEALTSLLYHHGKFSDQDVRATALAVAAYGVGILGLVAVKILAPGFFARQDTKTPVKIAVLVLIFTQFLNWLLLPRLGHVALALSISLGAWLNAGLMLVSLLRSHAFKPRDDWLIFLLQVAAAATFMAFALTLIDARVDWIGLQSSPWLRAMKAIAVVAGAGLLYFGLLLLLGLDPIQLLRKQTAKKV